jgi:hypothetical protein
MINRMREYLARLLSPQMAKDQAAYRRIRSTLDDVRYWCHHDHPVASAAAQFVIDDDDWYQGVIDIRDLPWRPPPYARRIDTFRNWLDTMPFNKRESSED